MNAEFMKWAKRLLEGLDAMVNVMHLGDFAGKFGDKFEDRTKEFLKRPPRGELFDEIRLMPKKYRDRIEARLAEAERCGKEDILVRSLTYIPRESWRDALEWLATLSDAEFKTMVDILDDNIIEQFFTRFGENIKAFGRLVRQVGHSAGRVAERNLVRIGRSTEDLADWLESLPGGRR